MFLSAVSVLVAAQSSSEIPEGLMINPVFWRMCGAGVPGTVGGVIVTVDYLRPTEGPLETSKLQRVVERTQHTCPLKSRVPCVLQLKCGVHRFRLTVRSVALQPSVAVHCEKDTYIYVFIQICVA